MSIKFNYDRRTDTSCASTAEPQEFLSLPRLAIVLDGVKFEWFQISDELIHDISLDIFLSKLEDHVGIPGRDLILRDRFGFITTTADLRRTLCLGNPTILLSRWDEDPRTDLVKRVTLKKSSVADRFGLGIIDSEDGSHLIVSEILPLGAICENKIMEGDAIVSVNGHVGVQAMRRELGSAITVDLDVVKYEPDTV
jgi:hypothetical protein